MSDNYDASSAPLPYLPSVSGAPAEPSPATDITVWQGDAFELLRQVPGESVDLVVTDPPYASLEKHRATGTTTRLKKSKGSSNAWFPIIGNERLPELLAQLWRVMRRNSHLFMFADEETAYLLKPMAEQVGFTTWTSLTWVKTRTSMPDDLSERPEELAAAMVHQGMGYHYRCSTERILFFEKGKRRLNDLGVPNVLFGPRAGKNDYPTQKPLPVVETLVANSSAPGELVLDPFCGSGTVGLAARHLGRRALLMDVDTEAAKSRLPP